MANPFDQFDEVKSANPFDQFDETPQAKTSDSPKVESKAPVVDDIGAAESFLIGMGKGFTDIGKGLGLMEDTRPSEAAAYKQLEEQSPYASMAGEITGQALPFIPAALAAEAAVPIMAAKGGLGAIGTQVA